MLSSDSSDDDCGYSGEEHEPKPTWVKIAGPFTEEDNFCADLSLLQQRCGCIDKTLGMLQKHSGSKYLLWGK